MKLRIIVKSDRALHQILSSSTKRAERLKQACNSNSITGKEYGIPFPTEKLAFKPVYRVPIKILSFNFANGRIASEKITLESKRGKKLDTDSEKDQELVGEILLNSQWYGKKATEQLKASLSIEQQTPGIVTFDGILLNGNRRAACLNSLFEDNGKPQFKLIDIVVLPQVGVDELLDLENRLQLAKDFREKYGPVNERIRLRYLKEKRKFSMKQIINSVRQNWNEKEINKMIEEINLIDEFLKAAKKPNQYDEILKKGVESFTGLIQAINQPAGIKNSTRAKIEKQKRKLIGFGLINHPKTTYHHLRDYGKVLKNPKACKEFLDNSKIYKAKSVSVVTNPKILADELENLEFSKGLVKSSNASPSVLAKAAYKKMDDIAMDRIQKGDKDLWNYITKIEKILDRINKKR